MCRTRGFERGVGKADQGMVGGGGRRRLPGVMSSLGADARSGVVVTLPSVIVTPCCLRLGRETCLFFIAYHFFYFVTISYLRHILPTLVHDALSLTSNIS